MKSSVLEPPIDPNVVRKWESDKATDEWLRDLRSRLEWRSNFDSVLRRLILDTELDVEAIMNPDALLVSPPRKLCTEEKCTFVWVEHIMCQC